MSKTLHPHLTPLLFLLHSLYSPLKVLLTSTSEYIPGMTASHYFYCSIIIFFQAIVSHFDNVRSLLIGLLAFSLALLQYIIHSYVLSKSVCHTSFPDKHILMVSYYTQINSESFTMTFRALCDLAPVSLMSPLSTSLTPFQSYQPPFWSSNNFLLYNVVFVAFSSDATPSQLQCEYLLLTLPRWHWW